MRLFLGLLLALVAASAIGMLILLPERAVSTQGKATSLTASRIALRQIAGEGPTPRYGGTPIYDACTVITIADLDRLGVPLNDGWVVTHDYLDRDVPPEAAVSQPSLEPAGASSYRLQNWNSLRIGVHQTPYNSAEDVAFASGRAARERADVRVEDGFSLARWHDTDSWDIDLWRSGLLVQASLATDKPGRYGPFDAEALATKLEPLVKAAVLRGPTARCGTTTPRRSTG